MLTVSPEEEQKGGGGIMYSTKLNLMLRLLF